MLYFIIYITFYDICKIFAPEYPKEAVSNNAKEGFSKPSISEYNSER